MKTALILVHELHEGAGQFGDILKARGFKVKNIHTPSEDISGLDTNSYNLLMVMGGPVGVYEGDDYPYLKLETKLLEKRIAADLPTFGVCLGSQLIAAALGEKIFKGAAGPEIGWNPLKIKENIEGPIRHLAGDKTNMLHWHGDTFDLPEGTTLLASSSLYENQAFSFGCNIMAVQFHPEVTPAMAKEWLEVMGGDVARSKLTTDMEKLRAQTEKNIHTMNVQAKLFFEEWLESVEL